MRRLAEGRSSAGYRKARRRSSVAIASPESTVAAASARPLCRSPASPATMSAAAALSRTMSRVAPGWPARTASRTAAFSTAVVPPASAPQSRCAQAKSARLKRPGLGRPPHPNFGEQACAGRRQLVESISVHHQRVPHTEHLHRFGHHGDLRLRPHAHHLGLRTGGVGQRAGQVEDRPEAQRPPHRRRPRHCRLQRGRVQKHESRRPQACDGLLRRERYRHTQRFEHVRGAAL